MRLEDTLVSMLATEDLRPLVRALCACARRQLPRAVQIDPFNATIVETAEAWAAGACTTAHVEEIAQRAKKTRGATTSWTCVGVIVAPAAERTEIVRHFARHLPYALWFASQAGQRWVAKVGPRMQVGQDPAAMAEVAAADAELAELAKLG